MGAECAPFGNEDDGVEFDAVAHGDHDVAAGVVEGVGDGLELRGRFVGEGGGGLGEGRRREA